MKKKSEVTNLEILEALNEFSTSVDKRFDGVDKRFDGVESRLAHLEFNQEEILLKLDNKACKLDVINLTKRVELLEGK
ncbi:MAG: hypothetical protein WCS88_01890 [Patescibacteria group bacterium]|jgi:hypothetical protein